MFIHKGNEFEDHFENERVFPDPNKDTNPECTCGKDPYDFGPEWTKMAVVHGDVSEENSTHVHRTEEMADKGELLFPSNNVYETVIKSQFDTDYGRRHFRFW